MRYIMVVIAMTLTYIDLSRGQDTHAEREVASLEGIPGVRVVIEDIESDAREDGLTKGAIHAAVEEILVSGDVRLLTQEEWSAALSRPWLYIQVFSYKSFHIRTTPTLNML